MDIDKTMNKIKNLNVYIAVTQEINNTIQNSKPQFNLSTVLSLKKVRALEIEYFNKSEDRGAALIIFEHIVKQPPSKTWEFLGKELVNLLQYWLDATRKHLIKQNYNWWNFMIQLLKFLKHIRQKDKTLPDILVNHTAECLLDLATATEPNALQRLEILYCLNLCCAEASRDIRKTLKDNLDSYFTKLADRLATCYHLPTQFSVLETLLRWLVPRHDPAVRHAAALKWFPEAVYGWRPVQLFLERPWQYFFQDARDFLNAFNEKADLITSVLCRKLVIGTVVVVSSAEKRETWIDVNTIENSVSILLDPRILEGLGISTDSWDILMLADDNILDIELYRDSSELVLSIQTCQVPVLFSSDVPLGDGCRLTTVIATKNIDKLDKVLRSQFVSRYKSSVDLEKMSYSMSPVDKMEKRAVVTEEDTRFSHPAETQRRKRSGYMVRSRNAQCKSPSTASTSSLAYLHEKLAHLPRFTFEKEAVNVCALPNLSTVTEISETDDRQSVTSTSTIRLARPYGVGQKTYKNKNSQSDSEAQINQKYGRHLSPSKKDNQNSTSCLLVATIGSDESVINDTLERITKSKEYQGDNIVDLLVQEALKNEKDKLEEINTCNDNKRSLERFQTNDDLNDILLDNNKSNTESKQNSKKACTVISNTTTEESNDVVYDTPFNFVNVKRRQRFVERKTVEDNQNNRPTFDVEDVENFFNQHLNENNRGEIVVSPTLARKINETSSESDQFDVCLLNTDNNASVLISDDNAHVELFDMQEIDIIECMNYIVDSVCNDLEKCNTILNKDCNKILNIVDNETANIVNVAYHSGKVLTDNSENVKSKGKTTKGIKLKFNSKRILKTRGATKKRKSKLDKETVSKMSPIIESKDESDDKLPKTITTPECKKDSASSDTLDLPLARRKRKLYSPKDENVYVHNEKKAISDSDEENEFKPSKPIKKYTATSYKDIEKDRAKQLKRSRTRRYRTKSERTLSPKTKEMNDLFDNLKDKVVSNDPVVLADKTNLKDLALYNMTSDSEDEDFKNKKLEIQKRISSTTLASADSSMTRRGRTSTRVNYSENKSSDEMPKKKVSKPKRNIKLKKGTKTKLIKKELSLVDEKMRKQAQEDLNASFVAENTIRSPDKDPELVLKERPELEPISNETGTKSKVVQKSSDMLRENRRKKDILSLKKEQLNKTDSETIGNRTESPLPSLVIEKMSTNKEDDLLSVNMLNKMKKIYENGFETTYNNDTNTTHNLLSDVDKTNISGHDVRNEEVIRIEDFEQITNEIINKAEVNTNVIKLSQKVIDVEENLKSKRKQNEELDIRKDEHTNRTKTVKGNDERKFDVIEILETNEVTSDKSIATVGKSPITAHGDDNEDPPDSRLLWRKLKPRNLEVEYLDDSIKDYYDKLSKEVHNYPSRLVFNDSAREHAKSNSSEVKSPVVSVARLSVNDISKWLPSRRSSETESSYSSPKSVTKPKNDSDGYNKVFPMKYRLRQRKQHASSESSQRRKSKRLENQNLSYASCSENSDCDIEPIKKVSKNIRRNFKEPCNSKSDEEKINFIRLLRSRKEIENKAREKNDSSTPTGTQDSKRTKRNQPHSLRKSIISPIKMFDEMYPSSQLESSKNTSNLKQTRVAEKFRQDLQISSPDSKMSTSTKIITTKSVTSKKKWKSPEINAAKRMKLEEVSLSESGPSVSSVNDWFKKIDPISRDQCVNNSLTETIQNVMEKLDTTLEEIHQNTSTNFIHMFVDAQKELTSVRQKRRQMFRAVASDIITEVVKVIDSKFADLDERSQEMDLKFMEQLKTQASVFIREDCKKKRIMINLLKEDMQVVLDHTNKKLRRT